MWGTADAWQSADSVCTLAVDQRLRGRAASAGGFGALCSASRVSAKSQQVFGGVLFIN